MTKREPSRFTKAALAFVLCALPAVSVGAQAPDSQAQPDNTKVNKQDHDEKQPTADKQKMNSSDTALTQKIRKSIIAEKSLSTYAHNVKIISQNGTVTLKGPVRSDEEVKTIVAKATEIAGDSGKVVNQLTVKP